MLFSLQFLRAQSIDDVKLVVSGDGTTKEEATHIALRSAIEQAYGVFVSANTEILNDELVKDEIATVTSGNVKSFKELNSVALANGQYSVTLEAIVSTKKLASYAASKGASCEFAGATFGANLKLIKLNQENTRIALEHLTNQCKAMIPSLFEPALNVTDPTADGKVSMTIEFYSTSVTYDFCSLISSTLRALQLTKVQEEQANSMNITVYPIDFFDNSPNEYINSGVNPSLAYKVPKQTLWGVFSKSLDFSGALYAPFPTDAFNKIIDTYLSGFIVKDNLSNPYSVYYTNCQMPIAFGKFVLGDDYKDTHRFERSKRALGTSCFVFNILRNYRGLGNIYNGTGEQEKTGIGVPLSYVRANSKSKSPKLLGKATRTITIPIETLTSITGFTVEHE